MPVHRVATADIESALAEIEPGERIVSVVESGDGAVLIFTEPKSQRRAPGGKETRA